MRAEVVDRPDRLEQVRTAWDSLAVAAGRPFSAPGWLLPWWRHCAPARAQLRTVLVHDDHGLAGVAPFFLGRGVAGLRALRPLATGISSRVEPLARPGLEHEVARTAAGAFAALGGDARVVHLDGVPAASPWPELLRGTWPGGASLAIERSEPAPSLGAGGRTYDEWFAAMSSHFRKRMRRGRRELDERGANFRLADADSVGRDLAAFAALHRSRWARKGGSGVLDAALELMLADAARELELGSRLRVWVLEVAGEPVAVEILLAAGGETSFWLGGFDEAWATVQPSLQTMLRAVEHAFALGDRRVDLGEGGQSFKYRLADGEELLRWIVLVPNGKGALRARGRLRAASVARRTAQRSPTLVRQLRRRLASRA